MKTQKHLFIGLSVLVATVSCSSGGSNKSEGKNLLADCPVVGRYVQVGNDQMLSCDQKLLTDTVSFPLSHFTEEMEIIKLDNRDEALVGPSRVSISDNYILVHSGYPPKAFKLFDRKGHFIAEVGAIGQGPGEYQNVYDAQIDEKNQCIYLMPWQSDKLLVFGMDGKALDPIPLGIRCPKACFKVDPEKNTVTVAVLPWAGEEPVVWTQDMKGNRLREVIATHLAVQRSFNHEVIVYRNVPGQFDFSLYCMMPPRVDSLYRYNEQEGRLQPVFTFAHATVDPVPWHGYCELTDYFTGNFSGPPVVRQTEHGSISTPGETFHYIIDKESCKGAYFKIYNDYLGDLPVDYPSGMFLKGYFMLNVEPGNLQTDIETALQNTSLSAAMKKKLTDLQNSIDENDNDYILVARLKK